MASETSYSTIKPTGGQNAAALSSAVRVQEQFVAFRLAGEIYGIPIMAVHEIIRPCEITPLPRVPAYVCGMINLRGKIVPVVDLRMRMGLPVEAQTGETRIVIAETGGLAVGMVVDAVREVMTLSEEECETPSEFITDVDSDLVVKVGKRDDTLILLMNLDKALHISTEDRQ